MLKAIAHFIANNTDFTYGTTIQYGWRPLDAPDTCHLVSEIGPSPGNFYVPERTDKMIQVLSRSKSYNIARAGAEEIYLFLKGAAGWDLPEIVEGEKYFAMVIEAISAPQYLGLQDDNSNRHQFSTNYMFKIRERE